MTDPQRNPRSVAVVGATGAVGEILLEVLAERRFPISRLRALASERSAGATVRFRGEALAVETVRPELFDGIDLVFFAATGALSKELAPEAQRRGAVVIDKSSTWRMDAAVPLVVPEVNPDAVMKHRGIVACPNCTTIGFVMALEPLRRAAGLRSVVVTTLQAASGAGRDGTDELSRQMDALAHGREPEAKVFPSPLAGNVLPLCESFRDDGYSTEEMKLLLETRKILDLPDLEVSMTCVRVPVAVGHSATLLVETERPLAPAAARAALAGFPGVRVVDDPSNNVFPTPRDVAGRDEVLVGRIRKDLSSDRLWLWEVSDNLRKGAATNAVQTAELLLARGLL
ncbi:MAG TPA: aspartate-semialdehyde dehydrogenase [Myxococcota bacterium]|nr:aspartate-semialdehyde dehydrogenase [Myxococcota bacterium]